MSLPMPEIQRKIAQHDDDIMAIYDILARVEGKVDGHTDRLDGIDGRLDGIDGRLDGIDGRLDRVEAQLTTVIGLLEQR